MIDRRTFLRGIAVGALAASPPGLAQPHKAYRIGILGVGYTSGDMAGAHPRAANVAALLDGMRAQGYVYGEHFVTEPRGAEGKPERYPGMASDMVRLQVDVIVAAGPTLAALKAATTTIPVVMAGAEDPVGIGVARSLAKPGGNFTGLSNQSVEAMAKRLELLKEVVPGPAPVAVLWDPPAILSWRMAETAASARGWKLHSLEVRDGSEIAAAIKSATAAGAGALLATGGLAFGNGRQIAEIAARNRLPTMVSGAPGVEDGALMSYGANLEDIWRRAALFVDKILKGARPADLPVEQPTKFELVVNLKTAKALGLTIPQPVLLRADKVIQ